MELKEGFSETDIYENEELIATAKESDKGAEKLVTVVFAETGAFKMESGSHDEIEEMALRKSQLDRELDSIVARYGGVVDKFIRQVLMANFGTKVQHADDPARAILAAMEIVECAKRYGVEVHVGINTGIAWVGAIGTEFDKDATVIGDTVNLAARLKGQAQNNQIIVSLNTYEKVKDLFLFEPLPPVRVKGISEPIPIYAVVGKTEKSELIEVLTEDENSRLARIQEAIPNYLKDKILNAKSRIEGERKPVTMLYSDVSGFTALSERFKDRPDLIAEIIDICHRELGKIIYEWEGVVDKLVGDEIMAIFGAPIVHEDDPERAIAAGLEMLRRMKEISKEISERYGTPPLDIHIGINTGKVSIGNISMDAGLKMDYTVVGQSVELAEKLEDISEPGQLIVGESTYRLTRALFDFKPLHPIEVGGRQVMVYEVIGAKAKPESKRGVKELNTTRMIGREKEFNKLIKSSESLRSGQRHVVSIIGEAGLGKSRMKRELKAAFAGSVTWMEASCLPHTEKTSYSLFIPLLRSYFGLDDQEEREESIVKIKSGLNALFADDPERVDEFAPLIGHVLSVRFDEFAEMFAYLDAQQIHDRTFIAIRDLFVAESRIRPLVIAMDDLHWIDPISLELIHFLIETTPQDAPLMFLFIYRPERTDPCWGIGEAAAAKLGDAYTEIFLKRLPRSVSRELLESLIDLSDAEELKEMILDRADGNPFYMEEVFRSLIDNGVLVKSDGTWRVAGEISEIKVPDSLEQVIGARIDKLEDEPKYVMQKSSVIGREFERIILEGILHDLRSSLDKHLEKLMALDMIRPATEDFLKYMFGHIVTYDITYSNITLPRRRRYHGEVGECIERVHADSLERFYGDLAHHYGESDRYDKAVNYLTLAGNRSKALFDNQSAYKLYRMGLRAYERLSPKKSAAVSEFRDQLYEGLGDVCSLLGEYNEAINYYRKREETCETDSQRASIECKIGLVYHKMAEWDKEMECFNLALELLKRDPDPVVEARVYNAIGKLQADRGDFHGASETLSKALSLVEGTENYDVLSNAYRYIGMCYHRTGKLDEAREYYQRGIQIAKRINDAIQLSRYYNNLSALYRTTGDLDRATGYIQMSIDQKEKTGDADGIILSTFNLALIYRDRGDMESSSRYIERALEIARKVGAQKRIGDIYNSLGSMAWHERKYDEAIDYYKKALEISMQLGAKLEIGQSYVNIADAYIFKNDLENGLKYSELAVSIAEELNQPDLNFQLYDNIGNIYWKKQDFERALENYRKALGAVGDESIHSSLVYFHIGQTLICLGQIEKAQEMLLKAQSICEKQGRKGETHQKINVALEIIGANLAAMKSHVCAGVAIDFQLPQCKECLNPGFDRHN